MPNHRDTARQFPWDRVPTETGFRVDVTNGAVPAVVTVPGSYTVPSGRKASVDAACIAAVCSTAVAGSYVRLEIVWTDGVSFFPYVTAMLNTAVLGNYVQSAIGQAGWLLAGHTIEERNNSVGGVSSITQICGAKCTECQA